MFLELKRIFNGNDSTIGLLSVNDNPFCFVIEDEHRGEKVAGETRIPKGVYKIELRNEGGMTKRYAERFPDIHKGMLWLRNVPGFEWIYIHVGNTDDHSEGCLLVNYGSTIDPVNGGGIGSKSTQCYKDLYALIIEAMERGENVHIIVKDWPCWKNFWT